MAVSTLRITSWLRRPLAGLAIAAAVLGMQAGTADAVGQADSQQTAFAQQARAAGLDSSQARQLQKQVDAVIARDGGTQIAANQVLWKDGNGDTTVPLPGEKRARSLSVMAEGGCAYQRFCLFQYQDFAGERHSLYNCGTYLTVYHWHSWVNNQSGRARAKFYDANGWLIYTTAQAYTSEPRSPHGDATHSVVPC